MRIRISVLRSLQILKQAQKLEKDTIWILLALLVSSLEPIIAKYSYRGSVTPLHIFVIRNIAAAMVLSPALLKLKRTDFAMGSLIKIFPVSMLLMTTGLCTLVALQSLPAATVITVVTTTPALVALINQRLGREILGKNFWLGFWLCFVGVMMSIDLTGFSVNPIGLICVFTAVVSSSIYRVRLESLTEEYSPLLASAFMCFFIGIVTLLFFAPQIIGPLSAGTIYVGAWIGITAAAANVAFITALHRVGATRISVLTMLQRPLLIIGAALFLKEHLTTIEIIGIVLVTVGMTYTKVTRIPKRDANHEDLSALEQQKSTVA
jgi:drug/metabolite transporter (DMT)-like permease